MHKNLTDLERIEKRYGLRLPPVYLEMRAQGWLEYAPPDHPNLLWLHDAEWMSLQEIVYYQPAEYHKLGYVPFATTAGGDHWCWWPSEHPDAVVLCPHDYELGDFYAPSFAGFIYRQLLDYARYVRAEDEQEVRQYLRTAASRLSEYLPGSWIETLTTTASAPRVEYFLPNGGEAGPGLVTEEQYQAIIQRDLAFPQLDQQFQWMFPTSAEDAEYLLIQRKVIAEADHTLTFNELMAGIEAEKSRRRGIM